ncbi:MFS transporter [Melghirimyces algeriensis]|uniref:Predicted arabinose efflux permease, MFS family n=1 Tax=Melghirimyces algeriensis TaxID=910412 RepID=A0A521CEN3_9BACL|nr:MFS transporter [Melghirimyces algeriensis]SMO57221.1 Predicted arabinose efflux permease, MFS family [Melghirimyces algeriensis]
MRNIVCPGIAMIGVSYAFARFSFGLFLPEISNTLGLTEASSGFIGSVAYVAYCIALLTSSLLIQKSGQNITIRLAGISAVLGMVGIALSPNTIVLAGSVFLAGLSTGWASPAFGNVAANELNKQDRDRGNTWINTGTSFGIILSGPIALVFTEYWRLSYTLFAIIALAVLIWNAKAIPMRKPKTTSFSFRKPMKLWNKSDRLILASFLIGISSSIYWAFSRSFLALEHNVSYTVSIWFWMIMGVSGIVGGSAGGFIQRVGIQCAYRIGVSLMITSVALLTVPHLSFSFLSAILFGITYIFLTGVFIVWGTRLFPKNPSIGISLSFLLLGLGQFVGTSVAGSVIEFSSYTAAFLLFSFIGLIGLLVRVKQLHV